MTMAELHMAVRKRLAEAGLTTFSLSVLVVEEHPNRVDVIWSVWVPRDDDHSPAKGNAYYHKSHEPARLLEYLDAVLAKDRPAVPEALTAIGEAPGETPS